MYPGKHVIRFSNGGHDENVTIVIGSGEQGRSVAAVFGAKPVPATTGAHPPPHAEAPGITHPGGSRALMIGGLAVTVAGAAFGAFELTRVPSACSISNNQCAAAPGDPVFAQAQSSVHLANIGWTVTSIGLVAAIGGTIWYFTGAHESEKQRIAVTPWAAPNSGGFAVGGAW